MFSNKVNLEEKVLYFYKFLLLKKSRTKSDNFYRKVGQVGQVGQIGQSRANVEKVGQIGQIGPLHFGVIVEFGFAQFIFAPNLYL